MRRKAHFYWVTGGEGGIRTLGSVATTPDFESGTFDHSATSPDSVSLIEAHILSGAQGGQAAHVGPQYLGHDDRTIGILVIFEHRH